MRKRLTLVLILVLAVAMLGTALTYAGGLGTRRSGQHQGRGLNLCADLTDDQRNEIHQMVTDMKEAGASRAKIHETVGTMLHGFGVELPEDWDQHQGRRRGGFRHLCADLTDAQRISIREMAMNMNESEASRAQIHAAVGEKLRGYGVELPESWSQYPTVENAETEETAPLPKVSGTTAVQSASWGEIKNQFK